MNISDLYNSKKPVISFEIFPPKLGINIETIFDKLHSFAELKPDFISVTYGAGGTKKGRTTEIASKILHEYKIESLAHFTCVGHSKELVDNMLEEMEQLDLTNILALRGDPPAGVEDFDYNQNAFLHASDLISYIKSKRKFSIAAAAYPEGHVNSPKIKYDMHYLKQKVDSGADFLITQLFFDNRVFYNFMDRCVLQGINCPISAGIMPIFSPSQIMRMTLLSGASIPGKIIKMLDDYKEDPKGLEEAGLEYAAMQIKDLIANGVEGIHICTMNKPEQTKKILSYSGLI